MGNMSSVTVFGVETVRAVAIVAVRRQRDGMDCAAAMLAVIAFR